METIGELMRFLSIELEKLANLRQKNANKHFKRFVRLVQMMVKHFEKRGFTWKALEQFETEFCQNKAKYGQRILTPLTPEATEKLTVLSAELGEIIEMLEKGNYHLELRVATFLKQSAESVLEGTFCVKQKELLKQLKMPAEMPA